MSLDIQLTNNHKESLRTTIAKEIQEKISKVFSLDA